MQKGISKKRATQINEHCAAAENAAKSAIEHAWQAGKLLLEEKAAQGHGKWLAWAKENIAVHRETWTRYMRLAEGYPKLPGTQQFGSINEAVAALPAPKSKTAPVERTPPRTIDLNAPLPEEVEYEQPVQAAHHGYTRQQALEYFGLNPLTEEVKKLVTRTKLSTLHPDKGGDPQEFDMARKLQELL